MFWSSPKCSKMTKIISSFDQQFSFLFKLRNIDEKTCRFVFWKFVKTCCELDNRFVCFGNNFLWTKKCQYCKWNFTGSNQKGCKFETFVDWYDSDGLFPRYGCLKNQLIFWLTWLINCSKLMYGFWIFYQRRHQDLESFLRRTAKWALILLCRPWSLKFVQLGIISQSETMNLYKALRPWF